MTSFRIRPRFRKIVSQNPSEVQSMIHQHLSKDGCRCVAIIVPDHVTMKIRPEEKHYWSPQLDLSLEEHQEGTLIRGLYGPAPSVWTLFLFGYGLLGVAALFIAIIGFSRISLDMEAPVLWVLPVLGGLAILIYALGQMGQKIGAEQTFILHHHFEEALHEQVRIR